MMAGAKPGALAVQYRSIKSIDVEQFARPEVRVILYPPEYKAGDLVCSYMEAPHRGRFSLPMGRLWYVRCRSDH